MVHNKIIQNIVKSCVLLNVYCFFLENEGDCVDDKNDENSTDIDDGEHNHSLSKKKQNF